MFGGIYIVLVPSDESSPSGDQAGVSDDTDHGAVAARADDGADGVLGDMSATVEWLRSQGFYEQQDEAYRVVSAQSPGFESAGIHQAVERALTAEGIDHLYEHQAEAIEHVHAGKNVVVATPTASGKTLCYAIPALERAVADNGMTLYLAPQNALLQDQEETLQELAGSLESGGRATVRRYHSGLGRSEKRAFKRELRPDIVLMTPDMAHTSLLPWATSSRNWRWLFSQLSQVVVDEVHSYRGIFGSKISLVFRRLNRLAEQFGQDPQYVCTSATIANAIEHAATVTGQESSSFELIDEDGSSRGERHWLLWNPPLTKAEKDRLRDGENDRTREESDRERSKTNREKRQPDAGGTGFSTGDSQGATGGERRSCHVQSKHLFCALVLRGYQVACFSNTRQNCEKYAQWSGRTVAEAVGEIETADFPPLPDVEEPSLADRVRAYHGSLNGAPRAHIETGLKTGAVRGVWSTSALGIGVDIGSLDVVILDGYPGSLMETFQWAGRAGRGDDECLVVLVGGNDPLDQRILEDPDRLFNGEFEKAIVNPENEAIVDDHLVCAADEWPLGLADERWFGDVFPDAVTRLERAGRLTRDLDETVVWRAPDADNIQYDTGLRNTGQQIVLKTTSGRKIGELDLRAALRDAHPNAIYRANGTTYQVEAVDYDQGVARLERYHDQETQEYTRLLYEKSVEVGGDLSALEQKTLRFDGTEIPAAVGPMVVSRDVRGYNYHESYDSDGQKREFETPVPEPETETTGFLMAMPARRGLALPEHVEKSDGDEDDDGFTSGYLAALHAIEHALIGLLPTAVLCDRQDIGGLSTNVHRRADGPAIFVHDAHDGGAGLSRAAFGNLETLLERTYDQIAECDCTDGCKRCVLSEYCGSANRDVWKDGATAVLGQILDVDDDAV